MPKETTMTTKKKPTTEPLTAAQAEAVRELVFELLDEFLHARLAPLLVNIMKSGTADMIRESVKQDIEDFGGDMQGLVLRELNFDEPQSKRGSPTKKRRWAQVLETREARDNATKAAFKREIRAESHGYVTSRSRDTGSRSAHASEEVTFANGARFAAGGTSE